MANLEDISSNKKKEVAKLLEEVQEAAPCEVVIWYRLDNNDVDIVYSSGLSRTKKVGALFLAAMGIANANNE